MKKTLKIEGMMCQRCVAHVTKALQDMEGVSSVEVNLKKKTAVVELSKDVTDETFISTITEAGYEVKKISWQKKQECDKIKQKTYMHICYDMLK